MRKYKEMNFGLLFLMGILLAGCQQDVANESSTTKQNSDEATTEESPNSGIEQNFISQMVPFNRFSSK